MGNCVSSPAAKESSPPVDKSPPPKPPQVKNVSPPTEPPAGPQSESCPPKEKTVKLKKGQILPYKTEDFEELYTVGKELGRGQFGVVYLANDKCGKPFAVKSLNKAQMTHPEDIEDVRNEVKILEHLKGHPNVVTVVGAYENKSTVYIAMELCEGGELFDRIVAKGHYSEKEAAAAFRGILESIYNCHVNNIMHRDLKPENFLLSSREDDAVVKLTDFGMSCFVADKCTVLTDLVGSPYYIAPEVLKFSYGIGADMWSAGVILYILLSGVPPFYAPTDRGVFKKIKEGNLDLETRTWPSVSESAKDLVRKLLNRDVSKRLTAEEALAHDWVRVGGTATDNLLDASVVDQLRAFAKQCHFRRAALGVIARNLGENEISGLKKIFNQIDEDGSGFVTIEELKLALEKSGQLTAQDELQALMEGLDADGSGTVGYEEFIAATLHIRKTFTNEQLQLAFDYFDTDKDGMISIDELKAALTRATSEPMEYYQEILEKYDLNKDGQIDTYEFMSMMNQMQEQDKDQKTRGNSTGKNAAEALTDEVSRQITKAKTRIRTR